MKADKSIVKAWFEEFIANVTGKKPVADVPDPAGTNPGEDPIQPPAPVDPENPIQAPDPVDPETTDVVIRDMAEVQAELNDFVDQVTERDTTIEALQAQITALQTDLAQAKGLPTQTFPKDDPLLDPGKPTTNAAAAEKNAQALRDVGK